MQKQQLERNIMAHKNNTQIKGADTFPLKFYAKATIRKEHYGTHEQNSGKKCWHFFPLKFYAKATIRKEHYGTHEQHSD